MYGRGLDKLLLVFGGICTALSVISLWLGSVISINTLFFIALASCFVLVMQIEGGTKYSLLTFFSVAILSFVLPVGKINAVYYAAFFGYYPIIKSYIERINKMSKELTVKTLFFIFISVASVTILKSFMMLTLNEKFSFGLIYVILVIALFVYDYALSMFFSFYMNTVRNKLRR